MHSIEERVKECIALQFMLSPEELKIDALLKDACGMDSLDQFEITIVLEHEFDIAIFDEEMLKFKTTQDIINCVRAKLRWKDEHAT